MLYNLRRHQLVGRYQQFCSEYATRVRNSGCHVKRIPLKIDTEKNEEDDPAFRRDRFVILVPPGTELPSLAEIQETAAAGAGASNKPETARLFTPPVELVFNRTLRQGARVEITKELVGEDLAQKVTHSTQSAFRSTRMKIWEFEEHIGFHINRAKLRLQQAKDPEKEAALEEEIEAFKKTKAIVLEHLLECDHREVSVRHSTGTAHKLSVKFTGGTPGVTIPPMLFIRTRPGVEVEEKEGGRRYQRLGNRIETPRLQVFDTEKFDPYRAEMDRVDTMS